jgi:hypothetical protein
LLWRAKLSYGPDQIEQWRGVATYVDRILRGEKAGELPIQAPTKYELVINLKTAKVIGPLRADEVIEVRRREFITLPPLPFFLHSKCSTYFPHPYERRMSSSTPRSIARVRSQACAVR